MKSSNKRAAIVGLFIAIGLTFLLSGILAIGNLHNTFVKKIKLTAVLNDVNGLQVGNNVWFSGVKIGTINQIGFFGKSQVKVVFKVDENAQQYIHKNALVKLSTDGLIGNKILVIFGGTADAAMIEDGDTLEVGKTVSTEDIMNTLQDNNKNLLSITANFKTVSDKLANGQGTVGKLLTDETLYNSLQATANSLHQASLNTEKLTSSLANYSAKLNEKGNLANELVTDTTVFNSIKATVAQLQSIAASANQLTANLKSDMNNDTTPIGVLLHNKQSGTELKTTISNLDSSSFKLNEDLEALQHNFLFRKYFKQQSKAQKNKKN